MEIKKTDSDDAEIFVERTSHKECDIFVFTDMCNTSEVS
jgi:hypothetical protein